MADSDFTPQWDIRECPICKETKPIVTVRGKVAKYCRPCEIAILMAKPRDKKTVIIVAVERECYG